MVQSGINAHPKGTRSPMQPMLGIYRGIVLNTYVTNDPENFRKLQVECDVLLIRNYAVYTQVPVKQANHGVNNLHDMWVPRPTTRSLSTNEELNLSSRSVRGTPTGIPTTPDDMDGDMVLIEFVEGMLDYPMITGAFTHEQSKRKIIVGSGWSEGDGGSSRGNPHKDEYYTRHAGTELRVNASGDLLIDSVGATTDLANETPTASGGQLRFRVKSAERLTVEMNGTDVLEVFKSGGQVRIDLGEGATERIVLGDSFLTFLNGFISKYLVHTHPTGVGPSGVPLDAPPQALMTDALLSDLAKTKKL